MHGGWEEEIRKYLWKKWNSRVQVSWSAKTFFFSLLIDYKETEESSTSEWQRLKGESEWWVMLGWVLFNLYSTFIQCSHMFSCPELLRLHFSNSLQSSRSWRGTCKRHLTRVFLIFLFFFICRSPCPQQLQQVLWKTNRKAAGICARDPRSRLRRRRKHHFHQRLFLRRHRPWCFFLGWKNAKAFPRRVHNCVPWAVPWQVSCWKMWISLL